MKRARSRNIFQRLARPRAELHLRSVLFRIRPEASAATGPPTRRYATDRPVGPHMQDGIASIRPSIVLPGTVVARSSAPKPPYFGKRRTVPSFCDTSDTRCGVEKTE